MTRGMRQSKIGDLDCRLTDHEECSQCLVLLHGYGAPGDDLVPFAEPLATPSRAVVFPAGPIDLSGGAGFARAWWHLDVARLQWMAASGQLEAWLDEEPPELDVLAGRLGTLIGGICERWQLDTDKVVLGGFSQGAIASVHTALSVGKPLAGLVIMSGTLAARQRWLSQIPRWSGCPIWISHGRHDPVVPFVGAQLLREVFETHGHHVEWLEFDGGHGVPPHAVTRLRSFLDAVLG